MINVTSAYQGQSTIELHPFKHIVGVDPSDAMLTSARQYAASQLGDVSSRDQNGEKKKEQIEFVKSSAEDLGFLKDGSVDLLTSCEWNFFFSSNSLHQI